jgi:hypothetical protein
MLKNGNRRVKVNALLDDASTKTYTNADVAAELGFHGQVKSMSSYWFSRFSSYISIRIMQI